MITQRIAWLPVDDELVLDMNTIHSVAEHCRHRNSAAECRLPRVDVLSDRDSR